ncbi:hypothetical protein HYC85_010664 [Camellia sinensis]|uniref:Acyl carrier protein n=1 Tax=Camellia sinensis TaxID=4442 RepID=A0A7J7HII3_CAMSI|nr:hypothetical protein HYC85_010664 [Camellia sinensis]
MDLRFYIHKLSCEVIVNGAPYWMLSTASNHCLCFTWFDVQNEAFVMLPGLDFSGFYNGTSVDWKLMDWKDNAAVVVCCPGNPCVDVWMLEDRCGGESNWCRKFVIGPVMGVEREFGFDQRIQTTRTEQSALMFCKGDMTPDVHFQKDLGLDSFDNVEIVLPLEEEFELEIPIKKLRRLTPWDLVLLDLCPGCGLTSLCGGTRELNLTGLSGNAFYVAFVGLELGVCPKRYLSFVEREEIDVHILKVPWRGRICLKDTVPNTGLDQIII